MSDVLLTSDRDLRRRCRLPELMDDPKIDRALHLAALNGLRRINRLSRCSSTFWPKIRSLSPNPGRTAIRVLDLACGGGDVAVDLAQRAANEKRDVLVDGCDISLFSVEQSTRLAASRRVAGVRFFQRNAITDPLPDDYDVLMCSLFLHHLNRQDAQSLLARMKAAARQLVLVNDLRRTRLGYAMALLACHALTRSPVVHVDGPLSVRAAFSLDEVRGLATESGMPDATVTPRWPQRFLLSWRRPA